MAKVKIRMDYDWLRGYLRYGHREGILEFVDDEEYEEFKKDPKLFLNETGAYCDLDFVLDDYDIEDHGDYELKYEEIADE